MSVLKASQKKASKGEAFLSKSSTAAYGIHGTTISGIPEIRERDVTIQFRLQNMPKKKNTRIPDLQKKRLSKSKKWM